MKFSAKHLSILLLVVLPIVLFVAILKAMPPRPVPLPESGMGVLAFSFDGKKVAAGGMGKSSSDVKIWDTETHQLELTIDTKATVTKAVAFSPDGTLLATGVQGSSWPNEILPVAVWNTKTGQLVAEFANKPGELGARSLYYSPDGQILCGAKHGKIYFWDATKNYKVKQTIPGEMDIYSMGYNGKFLVYGGTNGVRSYSLNPQKSLPVPALGWGSIYAVALSADGTTAAASGQDPTIVVWDIQTGQVKMKSSHPGAGSVDVLALSPDGQTVVSGAGNILMWNVNTGKMIRDLGNSSFWGQGSFVAFSSDGSQLAFSSRGSATSGDAIQLLTIR